MCIVAGSINYRFLTGCLVLADITAISLFRPLTLAGLTEMDICKRENVTYWVLSILRKSWTRSFQQHRDGNLGIKKCTQVVSTHT